MLSPVKDSPLGRLASEWIEIPYSSPARHDSPHHSHDGNQFGSIGNLASILFESSLQFVLTLLCSLMFTHNYENSQKLLRQYGELYLQDNPDVSKLAKPLSH